VSVTPVLEAARAELNDRCNAIEGCYEFMLAYAAQGLADDSSNSQVRESLSKCSLALGDLAALIERFVAQIGAESTAPYAAFIAVLDRDARDAQAAVQLVLAQSKISSQLVDNLNASIHLRALLTDLFLIDEVLKTHRRQS
jgi:DNA polymerase III delta prime subunit